LRVLVSLLVLLLLTGARDPILVPEVSQHEIQVRQGFTGTELLLFGAIMTPEGTRIGRDLDIVVVLKGPTRSILLREKQKVAGIWINAASTGFRSAPSFFAVASSRPVSQIVDDKTAAIYELGLPWLQLSPIGAIDPREQARFAAGLVDLMARKGLYGQYDHAVKLSGQVLYQALSGPDRSAVERADGNLHRRNVRDHPRPRGGVGHQPGGSAQTWLRAGHCRVRGRLVALLRDPGGGDLGRDGLGGGTSFGTGLVVLLSHILTG
jgi:hypothetical protein